MGKLLDEDTIIKVLEHWKEAFKENSHHVSASDLSLVIKDVRELPPAQPETLTDKEQRIFLAAMGREEKVCRQVDDECGDCRDSDSLVRTCHEITRKVKGTLWT